MDEEPILLSFESVVKLIRSSSKGTSCGVDNFPIDILKQLSKTVVKKEFPVETWTFLELLTSFFNLVFTFGHCPSGMLPFYDAGESIRLLQGQRRSGLSGRRKHTARLSTLPSCYRIGWSCRRNSETYSSVERPSGSSGCRTRSTFTSV